LVSIQTTRYAVEGPCLILRLDAVTVACLNTHVVNGAASALFEVPGSIPGSKLTQMASIIINANFFFIRSLREIYRFADWKMTGR